MVQNSLESNVPDEQSSELAIACAKKMGCADSFSHSLGIQLSHIDVGKSIMTLQVTANMVNGYNTCHGGVIFSFADTAFAYACNSQNQLAVAASCNIDFVRPAMIRSLPPLLCNIRDTEPAYTKPLLLTKTINLLPSLKAIQRA
jgi:hypothetical protein